MCLICVEYYFNRMTKEEVKNALPEMVLFAKNEEEKSHFKKLQAIDSIEELEEEAQNYVSQNPHSSKDKYEYKASIKTRRS